jgi:hypothetical protein
VPSHAGGLEIIGPVGVITTPQLSDTGGGDGITILATQSELPEVGVIGAKGEYSIVYVYTQTEDNPVQSVYVYE